MAKVKQQADNCLALFRGNSISTIERGIKALGTPVINELCSRFNCSKSDLAAKIALQ